jgi:hypothetical protein
MISLGTLEMHANLMEIHMQSITPERIHIIAELLLTMMHNLKHSTRSHYNTVLDTVNNINMMMNESMDNTVHCTTHSQLRAPDSADALNDLVDEMEEQDMILMICMKIPHRSIDSPLFAPVQYIDQNEYFIAIDARAAFQWPWSNILQELDIPEHEIHIMIH